jgi:hypothetical protein
MGGGGVGGGGLDAEPGEAEEGGDEHARHTFAKLHGLLSLVPV